MKFQLSDYQATVETAVLGLVRRFRDIPAGHDGFVLYGEALDGAIAEAGFHEVGEDDELGPLMAALVTSEIAKLPACVEVAASCLVRPALSAGLPRPLALTERPSQPIRFLPQARTLLILEGDRVRQLELAEGDVAPVASLSAYPCGTLAPAALARATVCALDAAELRRLWRLALAAEIHGAIAGGLEVTLEHVRQRQQFGKPLGAFQAVQHRLAEVAVQMHALKWLTLRAAESGTREDAAIACGYAQDAARLAAHELHQFHGAIGMTLEYPLHLWTYRLKALLSDLGGAGAQTTALAALTWGPAA